MSLELLNESHLSGTASVYLEEMYEAWAQDPKSVHASWDAYFRGASYTAPPSLGNTKPNEGKDWSKKNIKNSKYF